MTTSPQAATLLPMTVPFSERLSETWLLERTYHAQLRNGRELSVPDLTLAMKQLNDFDVLLFLQSSKSKLAERLPLKKSTNFYVPLSTWREISQEEASATSQQGIPNNRDNCQLSQRCRREVNQNTHVTGSRQVCTISAICEGHCKKEHYLRHLLARIALFQETMQTEQNRISREYIPTNNKPLQKQSALCLNA
jgi:hypothetical protein